MSFAPPTHRAVHVDGVRLLKTIAELAQFGADSQGGVSREAFTPADDQAREFLGGVAREAGLSTRVDQAGNLIVRAAGKPSGRPILLMGSHIDSVTNGGRFDGAYGVVAAIEALRTFVEQGIDTRYEPVAIGFANEEGALFPYPFWGSKAVTGTLDNPASATDRDGRSIRGPLRRAGGDLDTIGSAAWPPGSIAAYLELHIEQGPVLERRGLPLGVVDGIVGRTIVDVDIRGQRNHAGTTPMDDREDALVAAAQLVLAVEKISKQRRLCSVSTVGLLDVDNPQVNVVPGECRLSIDMRDVHPRNLLRAEKAVTDMVEQLAEHTGTEITAEVSMRSRPAHADPGLTAAIVETAEQLGLPYMTLPSGAGHDAQIIAGIAPFGMIFVPSTNGVSHAPEEHTDDAHLVAGADALATTAANLRGRQP